jgi:hypothetical protein
MARVDSSGSFSFSSVVPGAILVAKAKLPSAYYAEPWVLTTYEPDDELVCEIQARSAARLNVLVRDSRGSAVAGAILTWEDALESAGLSAPVLSALASPHVAVTGDAGCAEISGRPGAAVRLDVRHGSYADRLGMYPVLHEGDRPLEILLLAETRIDGTVVGIDGGVVPGAVVTAHFRVNDVEGAPYEEIARAIADQNGEFALVFSEFNSPIQLRAQHGGARAERRWERGDDTQVRLTIP